VEGLDQEGESLLLEALTKDPKLSDTHFYLGFYYKKIGRLEAAREHLEKGLALEEWAPGLTVLGEVCRRLKLLDQARVYFERATILEPGNAEAWYGLGLSYSFLDKDKAVEAFRKAIAADPNEASAHRELGHMLWRRGELAAAKESILVALSLNDEDPWAHNYLGNLLSVDGRHAEAEQEFRRAVDLWSEVPLFVCNLGDALAKQGRMSEAERAYAHALTLDVNNYIANLRYGQILEERGFLEKATVYIERALKSKPSDHRARATLARIRAASRKWRSDPG
jgi:tetratricopeptide (TPR) repeat protein